MTMAKEKVTFDLSKNDDVTRISNKKNPIIPFCMFIERKLRHERMKNKKVVTVSKITEKDHQIFRQAYKKLMSQRARQSKKILKTVALTNPVQKAKSAKKSSSASGDCIDSKDTIPKCTMKCFTSKSTTSIKKAKSKISKKLPKLDAKRIVAQKQIVLPPIKRKPWSPPEPPKRQPRPVVEIPPFKTRQWVPASRAKPKFRPVVEYPPLKFRKSSPKEQQKPKTPAKSRLAKTFYPLPVPTLGKTWHHFKSISSKIQILCGKTSQFSKKFNFVSNGKQSAFISAVALINSQFIPMMYWITDDLDEVVNYGDINYRKELRKFGRHAIIKPPEIKFRFYHSHAKTYTEIGARTLKGVFDGYDTNSIMEQMEDILKEYSGLIFTYCDQSFAIWKESSAFYLFNSLDSDDHGRIVSKKCGGCCAIRSPHSLAPLAEYLAGILHVKRKCYEIYSFRINEKFSLPDDVKKVNNLQEVTEETDEAGESSVPSTDIEQQKDFLSAKKHPTELKVLMFEQQPEHEFSKYFYDSPQTPITHGYLKGKDYQTKEEKDTRQAPFIAAVAIAMLGICKSSLWRPTTISEIFKKGREIFFENVEKALQERVERRLQRINDMQADKENPSENERKGKTHDDKEKDDEISLTLQHKKKIRKDKKKKSEPVGKEIDIPITEILPVVTFGKFNLEIQTDNVLFGKVLSRANDAVSLEDGIKLFFKSFDAGLVQGPDVVAIWRERDRYFMFDVNKCNEYRREKRSENVDEFNSCLSWFTDLKDMINLYIENVPRNYRNDIFKICKVETRQYIQKSADWQNFKAISANKWILSGTILAAHQEFNEVNRNHQSTCISIVAIAKTQELGIPSWTSETIDEIVRTGDEFHSGCLAKLQRNGKIVTPNLQLNEVGAELKLEKAIVDLSYDECVINGILLSQEPNDVTLETGLEKFFADEEMGLLTSCDITVAIMKRDDIFYIFDSRQCDDIGRNLRAFDPQNVCTIPGFACVIRFASIHDMSRHLMFNLEFSDSPVFNISRVEAKVQSSNPPCFNHYKKLDGVEYAAMLRSFDEFHEDRDPYRSIMRQKTLCNLLAFLGFSKVLSPRHWSSTDINEILKIGYKLLCSIDGLIKTSETDFPWKLLEVIELSALKMTINVIQKETGSFSGKTSILASICGQEEIIEENILIIDAEKMTSRKSLNISQLQSEASIISHAEDETMPSLKVILEQLDSQCEFHAMLHSSLFDVAIIKMERFFYVFDPKASDHGGKLVRKRLEEFVKRIRMDEKMNLYNKTDLKYPRPSLEKELQEIVFGRPVTFVVPLVRPSMGNISWKISDELAPVSIYDTGSAYVGWFTTIDLLHEHIMKKVPNGFKNEKFTMEVFVITKNTTNDIVELVNWNNFYAISSSHWILRANISQNESKFSEINRNKQDVSNCIMALTFAQLCGPTDWNNIVLDVILKLGDRLYTKSMLQWTQAKITTEYGNAQLKLHQMDLPFFIRPFVVSLKDELVHKGMMVRSSDQEPMETMKRNVSQFLESCSDAAAILMAKDYYYVAIWRCEDGALMMFDPHDIGPDGKRKFNGTACIQRFNDHRKLVEVFATNILSLDGTKEYELIKISIVRNYFKDNDGDDCIKTHKPDSLSMYSNYNLLTEMENDIRSIRARKNIECKSHSMPMTVCYAVATLSISRSLDPEFYTPDIIDRILLFGNDLAEECFEMNFTDFDLCQQSTCPNEINWNFELNHMTTNIQMDIFERGVISKYPCPSPCLLHSLEEFFEFHTIGILITQNFIVAIWKENCDYFIFYSCPITERGKISDDQLVAHPGIVIFKHFNDLYNNIMQNIGTQGMCGPFELRSCLITMNDLAYEAKDENLCIDGIKMDSRVKEIVVKPAVAVDSEHLSNHCTLKKKLMKHKDLEAFKKKNKKTLYKPHRSIVFGNISRNSLNPDSYNAAAISVSAVAMRSLRDINCWRGKTIDEVIKYGKRLYFESSCVHKTKDVPITKLIPLLYFCNTVVKLKVEPFREVPVENIEMEFIICTLQELFAYYQNGYILRGSECWTIFKSDKDFFLFDLFGNNVSDEKVQQRAALYKFKTLELMVEQILAILGIVFSFDCNEPLKLGGIMCRLSREMEPMKQSALSMIENAVQEFV